MNVLNARKKEWFAVYTKSHFERKVNDILTKKEITTFLPLRRGKSRIAGLYRFSEVPLFRSYLFINIDPTSEEYFNVLRTTGVSSIVKKAEKPCPVSFSVIKSLKRLVEKMNQEISIISKIKRGEKVRVIKGPLRGSEGEMVKIDNKKFVFVVNVDLLGRSMEISIPPEYVSKL